MKIVAATITEKLKRSDPDILTIDWKQFAFDLLIHSQTALAESTPRPTQSNKKKKKRDAKRLRDHDERPEYETSPPPLPPQDPTSDCIVLTQPFPLPNRQLDKTTAS